MTKEEAIQYLQDNNIHNLQGNNIHIIESFDELNYSQLVLTNTVIETYLKYDLIYELMTMLMLSRETSLQFMSYIEVGYTNGFDGWDINRILQSYYGQVGPVDKKTNAIVYYEDSPLKKRDFVVAKLCAYSEHKVGFKLYMPVIKEEHIRKLKIPYIDKWDNLHVPIQCIKNISNELVYLDSKEPTYVNYTKDIAETLRRKYQCITNGVRFTNEVDSKTKIYTIMDKNILQNFERINPFHDHIESNNCVLLNPNLSYFVPNIDKQIPIPHLLALFGYDEKEILKTLKQVSYMTNPIFCLGFGGLMTNFAFWCKRLQDYYGLEHIFKQFNVYDPDTLELSNLFKIPLNWKDYKVRTNCQDVFLNNLIPEAERRASLYKIDLFNTVTSICSKYRLSNKYFNYRVLKNAILIGGVDLDSRAEIYDTFINTDITYICASHYNNISDITIFPKLDRELTIETYGTINLNNFLLSMFKTTIELLKLLASGDYKGDDRNVMRWNINDEDFISNSKKSKVLKNICYAIN